LAYRGDHLMRVASQGGLAVVTGAAGGLGSTFANQLAKRGFQLLLVDRRRSQLEDVCNTVASRYGAVAEPYPVDFCNREELARLARLLEQRDDVELLVNNAGFGTTGYFADTDASYLVNMVDVHVAAPTMLTRAVLPGMIQRNSGGIINVSSVGAWFQSAGNTQYGSTKNYLAMFSMALNQELRGTNVHVQALCPGFTRTGFHGAESMKGYDSRCAPAAHMWMSADRVVNQSLRKFFRRSARRPVVVVPGFGYRIVSRLAQMPLLRPLMQRLTRLPRGAASSAQVAEQFPVAPISVAKRA
jgi:short-subunit dehydrogenase